MGHSPAHWSLGGLQGSMTGGLRLVVLQYFGDFRACKRELIDELQHVRGHSLALWQIGGQATHAAASAPGHALTASCATAWQAEAGDASSWSLSGLPPSKA